RIPSQNKKTQFSKNKDIALDYLFPDLRQS
ncbi:unnamed protein product, partial [marine sediment metagenome]